MSCHGELVIPDNLNHMKHTNAGSVVHIIKQNEQAREANSMANKS